MIEALAFGVDDDRAWSSKVFFCECVAMLAASKVEVVRVIGFGGRVSKVDGVRAPVEARTASTPAVESSETVVLARTETFAIAVEDDLTSALSTPTILADSKVDWRHVTIDRGDDSVIAVEVWRFETSIEQIWSRAEVTATVQSTSSRSCSVLDWTMLALLRN